MATPATPGAATAAPTPAPGPGSPNEIISPVRPGPALRKFS